MIRTKGQRIPFAVNLLACGFVVMQTTRVAGQSSSLYLESVEPLPVVSPGGTGSGLSPAMARVNLAVVRLPEPRQFSINDLITIIVRESIENDSKAEIETEKGTDFQGAISAFPKLDPSDLLQLKLRPSSMRNGTPRVDINFDNEFEGDGDVSRRDTFTTRITARILDVKPNGSLVLEARRYIRTDEEVLEMTLTGTCRKDDVTADNTILSTQLFDMRLVKEHQGELRKATKKGWITQFFEGIFNF